MAPINVQWLDQTFSSRTQAETVLRPYLEAGTITEHDYNLAVSFLPGKHRYWPAAYSAGATAVTVAYGQYVRTPKWSTRRTWAFGIAANVLGLVVGQVQRASVHVRFVKSLENQQGFLSALHELSGEKPSSGTAPSRPPSARSEDTEENGNSSGPSEVDTAWTTTTDPNPTSSSIVTPSSSAPTGSTPKSATRWDEIRTASARGAKPSSWDALRQSHEKTQVSDQLQSTEPPSVTNDADAERAREQARFDALLEAERRIAGR